VKDFYHGTIHLSSFQREPVDRAVVTKVRSAAAFDERVDIMFDHYDSLINKYANTLKYVDIVTDILKEMQPLTTIVINRKTGGRKQD
jgi:hypothetical protein